MCLWYFEFFDWFSNIDIAILKLEKEALPSSKVGYICLPASSSFVDFTGIELTISGWGKTSFEGNKSDVLKVATVNGVSNEECKVKLKKKIKLPKPCSALVRKNWCMWRGQCR